MVQGKSQAAVLKRLIHTPIEELEKESSRSTKEPLIEILDSGREQQQMRLITSLVCAARWADVA
jgi:hypothetical protein